MCNFCSGPITAISSKTLRVSTCSPIGTPFSSPFLMYEPSDVEKKGWGLDFETTNVWTHFSIRLVCAGAEEEGVGVDFESGVFFGFLWQKRFKGECRRNSCGCREKHPIFFWVKKASFMLKNRAQIGPNKVTTNTAQCSATKILDKKESATKYTREPRHAAVRLYHTRRSEDTRI